MANTFVRKISRSVGTSAEAVGGYTVAADTSGVLLGLTVSNTHATSVKVNILVDNGVNQYYLVKGATIESGGALIPIGGDHKMVMIAGESLKVSSDTASSIDAILSILEIFTAPSSAGDLMLLSGTEDLMSGSGTEDLNV